MEKPNNKNPNRETSMRETLIKIHQQIPRNINEYLHKYGRFFPFDMEVLVLPSSGVLNNLIEPKVGKIVGMDILQNKFFVSIELIPNDRKISSNYDESLYNYNVLCKSIIPKAGAQMIIEAHVTNVLPILYPLSVMNNVLLEKGMFSFKPAYLFLEALDIIPKIDNFEQIPFERSDVHFINHDDKVYQISHHNINIFLTNYESWKIKIINDKGYDDASFNVWEKVISFFNTYQIDYANFIDNHMAINKFDIINLLK